MANVSSAIPPAQGNQGPGTLPAGNATPPAITGTPAGSGSPGSTGVPSPHDNTAGLSSVGPQLQANARLGGIWQDAAGEPPADTELVSNLNTEQLHQLYGDNASAVHTLANADPINVRTATNLAQGGPIDQVNQVISKRPNMAVSDITKDDGMCIANDMLNPNNSAVLSNRADLKPDDLDGLMTTMQCCFKGQQGMATQAYDMCLQALQGTKIQPGDMGQMVEDMFNTPKPGSKLTQKDVLEMLDQSLGRIANGATPSDITTMLTGPKPTDGQPVDPNAPVFFDPWGKEPKPASAPPPPTEGAGGATPTGGTSTPGASAGGAASSGAASSGAAPASGGVSGGGGAKPA